MQERSGQGVGGFRSGLPLSAQRKVGLPMDLFCCFNPVGVNILTAVRSGSLYPVTLKLVAEEEMH